MKKLNKNEWIGIVVALVVVGLFMVFPQILKSVQKDTGIQVTPAGTIDSAIQPVEPTPISSSIDYPAQLPQ
ncbi:MAG: hypothetical protein PHV42_01605 [Candidatus Pacebacteria bacterium]|nr:hypothetical protein [Candidatus Paceibacterota bacterium]